MDRCYVVVEGLPAGGKTEILSLLARFYPAQIEILPEMVTQIATRENLDLFADRERLTEALVAEISHRRSQIEAILAQGMLCLEESHLGVHLAYSKALGDRSFVKAYPKIKPSLLSPDYYLRLDLPIDVSLARQRKRGTPQPPVKKETLEQMLAYLHAWHIEQKSSLVTINADNVPSFVLSQIEEFLGLHDDRAQTTRGKTFEFLLLLGRPASGKSEFIDFMNKCPVGRRIDRYHLAALHTVDDFPVLWEKFLEDDLWEQLGYARFFSKPLQENYAVINEAIWPFLIQKINAYVEKRFPKDPSIFHQSVLIEFSRGGKDGYAQALRSLSKRILSRAAILYISVSPAESRRRNTARYDRKKKNGVLTHSVPDEELGRTYGSDDWFDIAPHTNGTLFLDDVPVPYVTMNNEPESTDPIVLDHRYHEALEALYTLWRKYQP